MRKSGPIFPESLSGPKRISSSVEGSTLFGELHMSEKTHFRKEQRSRARKMARIYGVVTLIVLSTYFFAGFFLHPLFLVKDVREKIRAIGGTVSVLARVLAPPVKPIVSGVGGCSAGVPTGLLDWADDENSLSYDIDRDGAPLSTGVILSEYADATAVPGQTYSYVVTAFGPMGPGFEISDPISVTLPASCAVNPVPTITVQTFAGRNIAHEAQPYATTDRNPRFSWITNLLHARIDIVVEGGSEKVFATIFANDNGYFSWSYGGKLEYDRYTVSLRATDPGDASLFATSDFRIRIESEADDHKMARTIVVLTDTESERPREGGSSFDFSVRLPEGEFYAGDEVPVSVRIEGVSGDLLGKTGTASFSVIDASGVGIRESSEEVILRSGFSFEHRLDIPYGAAGKEYRLVVRITTPSYQVSREAGFRVLELPLLRLGSETITYEQVVSHVGWVSFLLLFLFLWWLLLFLREYFLYLQSVRHITGRDLHISGYF